MASLQRRGRPQNRPRKLRPAIPTLKALDLGRRFARMRATSIVDHRTTAFPALSMSILISADFASTVFIVVWRAWSLPDCWPVSLNARHEDLAISNRAHAPFAEPMTMDDRERPRRASRSHRLHLDGAAWQDRLPSKPWTVDAATFVPFST